MAVIDEKNTLDRLSILNLQNIADFDTKKKGEFLLLINHEFNIDYIHNLKQIFNNFKYLIFSNQLFFDESSFTKRLTPMFEIIKNSNFPELQNIFLEVTFQENILNPRLNKVEKSNCWGFVINRKNENVDIKYNYIFPNDDSKVVSFMLNNKYIFPLLTNQCNKYYNPWCNNLPNYQSSWLIKSLFSVENPLEEQIATLIEKLDIPHWAINYCVEAQNHELTIKKNSKEIEKLNNTNIDLESEKNSLINDNNFLWQDGDILEKSIEKQFLKFLPNWKILKKVDKEDILFEDENKNLYVFEIKGSVKLINEKWISQLAKYLIDIEEKYPNHKIYAILFINYQKDINPKDRKFQYNDDILKRVKAKQISVITSTRLYNLLKTKKTDELIKDITTSSIHDEKIIET